MKLIIVGIIITVILIFVLIFLFILNKKRKIKDILLKVDEAEESIGNLLKKKGEAILTINEMIEEKSDKIVVENKDEIKEQENITKHDMNKILNGYFDKILEIVEYNNEVILDDEESIELAKLKNISLDLAGVQKYYNENITILNNYQKSFPTSLFTSSKKKEPYINEKSEIFDILKD